ncbi:hypothetical protein ALC53_05867 [Atta colombica]|uniref:Uncharacterized protein n=1 Tax=Atta colombica TaxID=520822 RepID=A0A151I369_9HYME|nr:hypothetical protein ALC53_05867 [Atta colombica]
MTISNGFDFNNEIEYHSNNQVIVGITIEKFNRLTDEKIEK